MQELLAICFISKFIGRFSEIIMTVWCSSGCDWPWIWPWGYPFAFKALNRVLSFAIYERELLAWVCGRRLVCAFYIFFPNSSYYFFVVWKHQPCIGDIVWWVMRGALPRLVRRELKHGWSMKLYLIPIHDWSCEFQHSFPVPGSQDTRAGTLVCWWLCLVHWYGKGCVICSALIWYDTGLLYCCISWSECNLLLPV